ncbi:MAG: hypothetical protein IKU37_07870 [Candidatus Gastranaerophilales bacterium]|nr:hypothetical protein [Candidatus Gastranaerophilales bacterium]
MEDEEFYSIVLHEIGHALGILSYSPSIGDVMYLDTNSYAKTRVLNRDVNTVKDCMAIFDIFLLRKGI